MTNEELIRKYYSDHDEDAKHTESHIFEGEEKTVYAEIFKNIHVLQRFSNKLVDI